MRQQNTRLYSHQCLAPAQLLDEPVAWQHPHILDPLVRQPITLLPTSCDKVDPRRPLDPLKDVGRVLVSGRLKVGSVFGENVRSTFSVRFRLDIGAIGLDGIACRVALFSSASGSPVPQDVRYAYRYKGCSPFLVG
jgi:hypothetical protein